MSEEFRSGKENEQSNRNKEINRRRAGAQRMVRPIRPEQRYLSEGYYGERYGNDYGYGREGELIAPFGMDYDRSEYAYRYDLPDYTELDLIPGPYTGMGPRYHKRANERIEEEVRRRLEASTEVEADDIELEVFNGEVTLRGTVGDRLTKRLIEDIVETVPGVRDVHNRLHIG